MNEIMKPEGTVSGEAPGIFDSIKHVAANGMAFWLAREVQPYLGYETWESFENAIERAMEACRGTNVEVSHQFREITNLMNVGKGARREVKDYVLSRYACYLVAMNADPSKAQVAGAQTYFAVQTRRQELADASMKEMSEEDQRLMLREKIRESNNALRRTANGAGVSNFGFFGNAGYEGMYKASQAAVKKKKGIGQNEEFLDCIGPLELSANDFRIRLTEEKLRQGKTKGQRPAEEVHRTVGGKVRRLVIDEIGKPPEALERAESIKKIESRKRKQLKRK